MMSATLLHFLSSFWYLFFAETFNNTAPLKTNVQRWTNFSDTARRPNRVQWKKPIIKIIHSTAKYNKAYKKYMIDVI